MSEDIEVDASPETAAKDAILLVDGSFALRTELRPYWDVGIYLDVDFSVAEERASVRDAAAFGSPEMAKSVTQNRYHGAHRIHKIEAAPEEGASFVIRNTEPSHPEILARRV